MVTREETPPKAETIFEPSRGFHHDSFDLARRLFIDDGGHIVGLNAHFA